jgi:uncharacterized protein involved in type VI secretion and phage assembly
MPKARSEFDPLQHLKGERLYGVYSALVNDVRDPDNLGRVKVTLPWSAPGERTLYEAWARIATPMAGNHRGFWMIPDVGDEVLVAFQGGDARNPYVIGALWNAMDRPPQPMDAGGHNYIKQIRSRNGVSITLDDRNGQELCTLETPGGVKLTLRDGPGQAEIRDSNGNVVKLSSSGVEISSATRITLNAGEITLSTGVLRVDAALAKYSGALESDTLITNSADASNFTPGAGDVQ